MNLESIYETIKSIIPYAKNYIKGDNFVIQKLPEIEKMIEALDSIGGIKTLTSLFGFSKSPNDKSNTSQTTAQNNNQFENKNKIDFNNLKKIVIIQ